jgi:hypothetical protein
MHRERGALVMTTHHIEVCWRPRGRCHASIAGRTSSANEQHMPALNDQKLEHFAREVASMMRVDRAYIAVGFKPSLLAWHDGNVLALRPAVAARIEELRAEFRERALLHAEYLQRRRVSTAPEKIDHA